MNNQQLEYYTPDIEDLYIGYECEVGHYTYEFPNGLSKAIENYNKKILNIDDINRLVKIKEALHGINLPTIWIRVPYLTKEQLEKEGWKLDFSSYVTPGVVLYKEDYTVWIWSGDIKLIWIRGKNDESLFKGECKSINEFRKICKMLNINGK